MARALVIAAHGAVRAQWRESLRDGGWQEVDVAATFAAAHTLLAHQPVDLIVAELLGSDGSALDLLDAIRQRTDKSAGTPVLVLANERQSQLLLSNADLGADALLLQPVTSKVLVERANWAHARYRALYPLWAQWHDPEPDEVAACWSRIAERHTPFRSAAARLTGLLLEQAGAWPQVAAHYEAILAQETPPWAILGQVRCAIARGCLPQARTQIESLLTTHPNYLAGWAELARLAELAGDLEAARTAYTRLLAAPVSRRQLHTALPTLLACGAHESVRQAVDLWLSHHPYPTQEDLLFLVLAHQEIGRFEAAQRFARQLIQQAKSPAGRALAHFAQFLIAYRQGAAAEALDGLRLALYFLSEAPLPNPLPEWLVRLLLAALAIEAVSGQATELLYRVRTHITDHATLQRLQALLSQAGALAQWEEAQNRLAEAAKRWVWQALLRHHDRDWLGAISLLTQATEEVPGAAAILFHLALAWLRAARQGAVPLEVGQAQARAAARRLRRLAPFYPGLTRIGAAFNAPNP